MFTDLVPAQPDPQAPEQFIALMAGWLADHTFARLVLSRYEGSEPGLQRLTVRALTLADRPHLSFLYRHATRDITKNHPVAEGLERLSALLGDGGFRHAHLHSLTEEVQLRFSKKGKSTLLRGKSQAPAVASAAAERHDREKHRHVDLSRPFLAALGVTDERGQLVPAMARKWRQINKFVEVFAHAFAASPLAPQTAPVRVLDFGSGKGYLTFAIHDHLQHTLIKHPMCFLMAPKELLFRISFI